MKERPDINDTLRDEGEDAARARHDNAWKDFAPRSRTRFRLKRFDEIKLSTEPDYRVKGLLPRVGLAVVWGPPKCGKSFWAFDVSMHIALDWEYRGRRVQPGPIVYCALEGGHGFAKRVEAWRQRHLGEHAGPVPFYLLDVPLDLVADHAALILAIKEQLGEDRPACVVVDTLNRALAGSENKPKTWPSSSAQPMPSGWRSGAS
jgi:RecA-family ATPase